MADPSPGAARIANLQSVFSGPEFLALLRYTAGAHPRQAIADPLAVVVAQIRANCAFVQSRLLLRILVTLVTGAGEFRRAEVSTLDMPALTLVLALADAHAAGSLPPDAWTRAIAGAQAAGS